MLHAIMRYVAEFLPSTLISAEFDPLIKEFGLNGNGLDRATLYLYYFYQYGRLRIHCTPYNSTHTTTDWYYTNGTRIGVRDRNFRAGHFTNGTAMLQIADYRPLSYCDGGNYTCIANSTSGVYQKRTFSLIISCKMLIHSLQWTFTKELLYDTF